MAHQLSDGVTYNRIIDKEIIILEMKHSFGSPPLTQSDVIDYNRKTILSLVELISENL